jgi:hypothetical protein
MRKLSVSTLVTLDGVIQDPGGFGETEQGGWGNPYFTEDDKIGSRFGAGSGSVAPAEIPPVGQPARKRARSTGRGRTRGTRDRS